jgi:hypothetical protein
MTTKTVKLNKGNTAKIEMVRKVEDKTAYLDGQRTTIGREVVDYVEITLCDENGNYIASGKELSTIIPADLRAKGAVASVGQAYLMQETASIIRAALDELEAENPKSDEQIAIETKQAKAIADHDAWYNSPDQIAHRKLMREMDDPNSDY